MKDRKFLSVRVKMIKIKTIDEFLDNRIAEEIKRSNDNVKDLENLKACAKRLIKPI